MTNKAGEQPTITQADIDCRNAIYKELTGLRVDDDIAAQPDWMDAHLARHRTTPLAAQDGLVEAFYIDCEFDGHNGPLLSIALVGDADSIHIKTTAPVQDDWVRENVLPLMDMHNAPKSASVSLNDVGNVIRAFLGDRKCPIIIADSPVDIGRFCRALSTGADGQWASADFPAMRFEVHNVDCYPTALEGAVQHNAWWDAMALKAALSAIKGDKS